MSSSNLTCGPVATRLRKQATPMAFGLIAIISFDAVDLFFISRLGDLPLAAVSFAFPVILLLGGIGIGFEAGAASCVSRAVGAGDEALARRLTTDTVLLVGLVFLGLCIAGLATISPLFRALGATDELMPTVHAYMGVWYWVEPVAAMLWAALAGMRARGNSQFESKVIIAAATINLVLDPILIFGLLGFPRLEVRGAAIASLIANASMLSFTLLYLHRRRHVFAPLRAPLAQVVQSWRRMLAIGVPAIVTNAIVPIANGIIVVMLAGYGVDAVAGFGIAMRIEPLALIPFYALSAVASPFAGQNSSARCFDRMYEARRVITRFCIVFGLGLALCLFVLAEPLASLFSDSVQIRSVAVRYLWLVSISYGAYGLVMSVNASFNGMGHPLPAVALSAARVIVVFLPLAWLGSHFLGIPGIFAAATVSNVLVATVGWLWLARQIGRLERASPAQPRSNAPRRQTLPG